MKGNELCIEFGCDPRNEGMARVLIASFMTRMNPTLNEMEDVKTAVSEAVTNAIIHGYQKGEGTITLKAYIDNKTIEIEIVDQGIGIADVGKAMEPMFTTCKDGNRSGMGFSFMEAFMDELSVTSSPFEGTVVLMKKTIGLDLGE